MSVEDGDVLRTTANFTLPDGTQYQNVYHHIADFVASFGDSTIVTAIDTWLGNIYANLLARVNSGTTIQVCNVDKVAWDGTEWAVIANVGSTVPSFSPTGSGDICPNQVSPFVVFKTQRPRSVGRKFLFPALETDQNQGILVSALTTALVAYAAGVMVDINMAPLSDLVAGIPRTAVDVFYPFLLAIVTDLVGTQRRRRPGVGA